MREENIKQAVAFLQKKGDDKTKEIGIEEKIKFLEGKLTEEELGEVRKRMAEVGTSSVSVVKSSGKDSVMQHVKNSPVAEQRL